MIKIAGDPKKYSCLVEHKMHKKGKVSKTETFLDYQSANLNLNVLVLIFCCHLAEI